MSEEKEKKVTTVQKLKSLIEAIDLISEDDSWKPSDKQWKKIKEMIETLEEPEPVVVQQQPAYAHHAAPAAPGTRPANPNTNAAPAARAPGPNPLESGVVNFPEIPVGEPPVIPDNKVARGGSSLNVDQPRQPQGSSNDVPEQPPKGPGL